MYWPDIVAEVQDMLGMKSKKGNRYSPIDIRRVGAICQQEICRLAKIYEVDATSVTTVTDQKAYTLPNNFFEMQEVTVDGWPTRQLDRMPVPKTYPSGQPSHYFLRADKTMWLYPAPSASDDTVATYYRALSPLYGLSITHTADSGNTGATLIVSGSTIVFNITGGVDAGAHSFSLVSASNNTISELVTVLNATFSTILVYSSQACNDDRPSTDLEAYAFGSIFNQTVYSFLDPEIPAEFHPIIVEGILYRQKYKDRELNFEQRSATAYYSMIDKARKDWVSRNTTTNNRKIKNVRRRGGNAGPNVFIS